MAKERGGYTVKAYLTRYAGMGALLQNVDSTDNAYVRAYAVSSSGPKFFSFLVSPLDGKELAAYQFLLP